MTPPVNLRSRAPFLAVLLVAASMAVAGCGGGDDSSDDTAKGPGALSHVDGTLVMQGNRLMVVPEGNGAADEFLVGSGVANSTIQALVASKARARVFYRADGDDEPARMAVAVQPAPTAGNGAKTYEGQITKVSSSSITIDGDDGTRTFAIKGADEAAFDVEHLEEHRDEGEPVRVYYRGSDASPNAVAYEDA